VYRDPIGTGEEQYTFVPASAYETQAYKLALTRIALAGVRLAKLLMQN
jgi:hypothetical protein